MQIQEPQTKLNEERERLCLLQQTLEREHAARARGRGARERARDINHRIIEDRAGETLVFNRASQNVVATAMLLHNMPEPSTPEAQRARDEI
jgi:cell division protein FtsI/penicillin-binding protein 2